MEKSCRSEAMMIITEVMGLHVAVPVCQSPLLCAGFKALGWPGLMAGTGDGDGDGEEKISQPSIYTNSRSTAPAAAYY